MYWISNGMDRNIILQPSMTLHMNSLLKIWMETGRQLKGKNMTIRSNSRSTLLTKWRYDTTSKKNETTSHRLGRQDKCRTHG
mmetsp:Transcript_23013/g.34895  ORF Transcript_23013/g.34895 Transcript_23013/m.34895 type:complete len:82 (+) Transcript_23013:247-492(+)